MSHQSIARIVGLGSYLPSRVLTNQDLEKIVATSNEWIISRTGIQERRLAGTDEYPSDMGAFAALKALEAAKIEPSHLDMIIVSTMTPDYISPSTASLIQAKIGATKAAAVDIQAACTGFLYALSLAKGYLEAGLGKNVIVIATEKMSSFIDYSDRSTCILFGDGAAAACVALGEEGLKIDHVCLGSDGSLADLAKISAGGAKNPTSTETLYQKQHYFTMSGSELFKHAVRRMGASVQECLAKMKLTEKDVRWFVPHQANKRIIQAIAEQFSIPEEKLYQAVLEKYGNTSSSSVAIALDELLCEHALKKGERILLTAFGAGLTWGAALLSQ